VKVKHKIASHYTESEILTSDKSLEILSSKLLVTRFLLALSALLHRLRTHVPLMSQMQELTAGSLQVEPTVGIYWHSWPRPAVFWVFLAVSKISNQFSVHSIWHSDRCRRTMFHHVLCQELEALQWWLAASRLTAVTGCGSDLHSMYRIGRVIHRKLL